MNLGVSVQQKERGSRKKRLHQIGAKVARVLWSPRNEWPKDSYLPWSQVQAAALLGYLIPGMLVQYKKTQYLVVGPELKTQILMEVNRGQS